MNKLTFFVALTLFMMPFTVKGEEVDAGNDIPSLELSDTNSSIVVYTVFTNVNIFNVPGLYTQLSAVIANHDEGYQGFVVGNPYNLGVPTPNPFGSTIYAYTIAYDADQLENASAVGAAVLQLAAQYNIYILVVSTTL